MTVGLCTGHLKMKKQTKSFIHYSQSDSLPITLKTYASPARVGPQPLNIQKCNLTLAGICQSTKTMKCVCTESVEICVGQQLIVCLETG